MMAATGRIPSCGRRSRSASYCSAVPAESDHVFYFAYGANMHPSVMTRRGVARPQPIPAVVNEGMCLSFRHRGGFATLVPKAEVSTGFVERQVVGIDPLSTAGSKEESQLAANLRTLSYYQPHGIVYSISRTDLAKLENAEQGYSLRPVVVTTYDGTRLEALAFKSSPLALLKEPKPPMSYYKELMVSGGKGTLCEVYLNWLRQLPTVQRRDDTYYETPSQTTALITIGIAAAMLLLMSQQ